MLKNHEKAQLKQKTIIREKMSQPMKTAFWEKSAYNFKTLASINHMQNSILEQAKAEQEIRQIWFSTR